MKVYIGLADEFTVKVVEMGVEAPRVYKIDHRLDLVNHSPTGLAWGYGGSGPAQCALAILADHLGDDDEALKFYQSYKRRVIAGLNTHQDFSLLDSDVRRVVERLRAECGDQ